MIKQVYDRSAHIDTPPLSGGLENELMEAIEKDFSVLDMAKRHAELWGFGNEGGIEETDLTVAHDLAHFIYAYAMALGPRSKTMEEKLETSAYQGDMQAEFWVAPVERSLQSMFFSPSRMMKLNLDGPDAETYLWIDSAYDERRDFFSRAEIGRIGAHYIAEFMQSPVFDVRRDFSANDKAILRTAIDLAECHETGKPLIAAEWYADQIQKRRADFTEEDETTVTNFIKDPPSWYTSLLEGMKSENKPQFTANGKTQILQDVYKPSEDPDWPVLKDRLINAQRFIFDNVAKIAAQDPHRFSYQNMRPAIKHEEIASTIKVRDLVDAMSPGILSFILTPSPHSQKPDLSLGPDI